MEIVYKIALIIFIILVSLLIIGGLLGYLAWSGADSESKAEMVQNAYNHCKEQGGQNCEAILAKGLKKVFETKKEELKGVIKDNSQAIEERLIALDLLYYLYRTDSDSMSHEESDLYYDLIKNNYPEGLKEEAIIYLLQTPAQDEEITRLQITMLQNSEVDAQNKRKIIKGLGETQDKEIIALLINLLKDENSEVSLATRDVLIKSGAQGNYLKILNIALDKNNILGTRNSAIEILQEWHIQENILDQELINGLKSLLEDESYVIRMSAVDALKIITGEEYEIEEGSQEEIKDFIEQEFNLIIE